MGVTAIQTVTKWIFDVLHRVQVKRVRTNFVMIFDPLYHSSLQTVKYECADQHHLDYLRIPSKIQIFENSQPMYTEDTVLARIEREPSWPFY